MKEPNPKQKKHLYSFGSFRLFVAERELFGGGGAVTLPPKTFDTLLLLVRRHGHVVDKDELMKTLWPDTFVEDDNLVQQVSHLRKTLGERPDGGRYVETVARRGYRFAVPVEESWEEEAEPRLGVTGQIENGAGPAGRRRRLVWLLGVACVLAAGLTDWFVVLRTGHDEPETVLGVIPVTSYPGDETYPGFSSDGSQIAFAWKREGSDNYDIYVKVVGSGEPLQLTRGPADNIAPAWSPDGRQIAFCRQSKDGTAIYTVSPLGGSERLLAQLGGGLPSPLMGYAPAQLSWSPDGELLAFTDQDSQRKPYSIWLLSIETGAKLRLTSPPAVWLGDGSSAFSPDGQTLAFVRVRAVGRADMYLVPTDGGEPRRLTFDDRHIDGLAWSADGREIVFSSNRTGEANLWRLSKSGGYPRLLAGIGEGCLPAIPRNGCRLVFAREASDTNIWHVEAAETGDVTMRATKLIASTKGDENPYFSPDGSRVAFTSSRSGSYQIWACDSDGSNLIQLTFVCAPGGAQLSSWSPDGRHIAFNSRMKGSWDIYSISSQGGAPRQLTADAAEDAWPSWSGDGRWIYFASNRTGACQVWKVPAEGGTPVQVTRNGGYAATESPDGKFVYYTKDRVVQDAWKVAVGGGEEVPVLESLEGRWCAKEKGLYFIDRTKSAVDGSKWFIQVFDFATRQVTPVVALEKEPLWQMPPAVSPDGRTFLYTRADANEADLMLVENFR